MNLEKTVVKLNLSVVEKLSTQLLNLGVAKHFLGPLHSHVFFLVKSENWRKIIKHQESSYFRKMQKCYLDYS